MNSGRSQSAMNNGSHGSEKRRRHPISFGSTAGASSRFGYMTHSPHGMSAAETALELTQRRFHLGKTKLKSRRQQPRRHDAAALENQFGFRAEKKRTQLEHPLRRRQAEQIGRAHGRTPI